MAAVLFGSTMLVACGDDGGEASAGTTVASSSASSTAGSGGAGGAGAGNASSSSVGGSGTGGAPAADLYEFDSRFTPGTSPLSYTGQRFRQLLIGEMKSYIGAMTGAIDGDKYSPKDVATTVAALEYYYKFDPASSGDDALGLAATPPEGCGAGCDWTKKTWNEVSTKGAKLENKMAGNDSKTDHKDWSKDFKGWAEQAIAANGGSTASPEGLLYAFFNTLGKLALDRENGTVPKVPGTSTDIDKVYVTADGLDLQQLIQKLLIVGVTFSQGADDYLDDQEYADAKKGLLSSNAQEDGKPYSALGHAWDEGFGYFGAARDYARYTDEEIAGKGGRPEYANGYHDSNGDKLIDFASEHNVALSVNCAKRDLGAKVATDFTKDAIEAFTAGRKIILAAGDELTTAELDSLKVQRDAVVGAWEKALAATVVHYVNDTIADTNAAGGNSYSFYDHAKHWAEMKAFALGLQFNPRSTMSDADFVKIHELMGDKPVLETATQAERDAYVTKLEQVRDIFKASYKFADENVKDW